MVWLLDTVGGSLVQKTRSKANWKETWNWQLSGQNAADFLEALLPYLVIKKERAELALMLYSLKRDGLTLSPELVAEREEIAILIDSLNVRGAVS